MQQNMPSDRSISEVKNPLDHHNSGIHCAIHECYQPGSASTKGSYDNQSSQNSSQNAGTELFLTNIFKDTFNALDSNHDGNLSLPEFSQFLKGVLGAGNSSEQPPLEKPPTAIPPEPISTQPVEIKPAPDKPVLHNPIEVKPSPDQPVVPKDEEPKDASDHYPALPSDVKSNMDMVTITGNAQAEKVLSTLGKFTKNADGSLVLDAQGKQLPPLDLRGVKNLTHRKRCFCEYRFAYKRGRSAH